jgi:N-acetylglucosamine-6-phosphate deacetylase
MIDKVPLLASHAFFDLQVNGFSGIDFNDPAITAAQYQPAIQKMWTTGVSRCLPTIITASQEVMCLCLKTAAQAAELPRIGPSIAGIHLEGPWISPHDGPRGAHPRSHVRPPDQDAFLRLEESAQGMIRMVTLAPELDGAAGFIAWLVEKGVAVSIGHSAASAQQIRDAISAGARFSTHLGNGCADTMHRHHNPLWEQLAADDLTASFIVDGHHLPAAVVKSMLRVKGERAILVTDATAPACCPPGRYKFGGADVELTQENRVQLAGTTRLAGSALRMDDAVALTVEWAGVPMDTALAMAGTRPAAAMGMSFPEDRVILDGFKVVETIRGGETVWKSTSSTAKT